MRRLIQSAMACLLVLAGLTVTPLAQPEAALAANTQVIVTECSEASFDAALAEVQASGGGTIRFSCSGTITFISQKVITSDVTIVGPDVVLDGGGSTRLFVVNRGARLVLTALVIQNGHIPWFDFGGAIFNNGGGVLEVVASHFHNNSAQNGGAISNSGTLTVTASTFSGNTAFDGGEHSRSYSGGAIKNSGGTFTGGATATITASTFSDNSAASNGGAIASSGALTVVASTFSGNGAYFAGAIANDRGTATIAASTFTGNSANFAGAIDSSGTLSVTTSTFTGNSATGNSPTGNGGAIRTAGTVIVTASTFSANSAGDAGGAFFNFGTLTVEASTFSGNNASRGGAILNSEEASLEVVASTFSGNSASGNWSGGSGGAIRNEFFRTGTGGRIAVRASILANSPQGGNCGGQMSPNHRHPSRGYNLSDDTSCDLISRGDKQGSGVTINLGPLQHSGGPTQTMLPASDSDAREAIPADVCLTYSTSPDQRGVPRPNDNCEIGAAEFGTIVVQPVEIITVYNLGPVIPGQPATIGVVALGPFGFQLTYEFDCDNDGVYEVSQRGDPRTSCTFAALGSHGVRVRVSLTPEMAASAQTTVVVLAAVPTITSLDLDPLPSTEGEAVALTAGFTNPDPNASHSCAINWGDGSDPEAGVVDEQDGGGTCQASHTYVDDGNVTVTVEVCNNDACTDATTSHMVINVAPSVSVPTVDPSPSDEDASVVAGASFSDPGTSDTHTCTVDYGDGDGPQAGTVEDDTCTGPEHSYADNAADGYSVIIKVCDEKACGSNSAKHTVNNVAPTVDTPEVNPSPSDEGQSVTASATFSDPGINDTHTCEIDWGDGTLQDGTLTEADGSGECFGNHTYADDDVYTIMVEVCDDDEDCDQATTTQIVNNVAPSVAIASLSDETGSPIEPGGVALAGLEITLEAGFSDPATLDTHTATIDWGDGSSVLLGAVTPGIGTLSGNHVYEAPGSYTISVCVEDNVAAEGCAARTLLVVDPASASGQASAALNDAVSNDPAAQAALAAALKELEGENGAQSKLAAGDANAGLVKLAKALEFLAAAAAADSNLDLSQVQNMLALTAKAVVVEALAQAEAVADSSGELKQVERAQALVAAGDALLAQGEYSGAIMKYQEALRKVDGII